MMDPEKWQPATLVGRTVWDDGLWTCTLDVVRDFKPGQYATLGVPVDGEEVKRAYSIASAPGRPLEFFIVRVDEGELTPRLWDMPEGGRVWVRDRIVGLFTLDKVAPAETLWLIATGTGLAPYVSMIRDGSIFERFEHVVLVHGVRHERQLAYREEIVAALADGRLSYVPACSREDGAGCLRGRLTDLVVGGAIEAATGRSLAPETSQVMLCGNPDMVNDMTRLLKARGMLLHTPRVHGHVHVERYW